MNIDLSWLQVISTIIGIIVSLKFFTKDLKSDLYRLNDKIDKRDNKLNDIDKNLELLKQKMSHYQESLNEIKETKEMIEETFKNINEFMNNIKKHNLPSNINKK